MHGQDAKFLPKTAKKRSKTANYWRSWGDFLPFKHVFERKSGPNSRGLRRRSLGIGPGGVDLVHHFRALPEAETARPDLDRRGARRLGPKKGPAARRARPD